MKRAALFEFEDQRWFPDWMRISLTRLIQVLHRLMKFDVTLARVLDEKLKVVNATSVVDLGSGAGGAMTDVFLLLRNKYQHNDLRLTLSDLYPNKTTIERIEAMQVVGLEYSKESINATKFEKVPKGLKTMINSFHHLDPTNAKKVLESAAKNQQPFFIYEMVDNKIPLLIWWLLLPFSLVIMILMVLFMTPFVKPLTIKQVIFTYLIPIIPMAYAWDGQASMPRIYSMQDYSELTKGIDLTKYTFEIDYVLNSKGKKQGYYVFGKPI